MRRILLLKQMKKANHLMPRILDMDNLRMAFWKASKGKRYAASVREYQNNLQQNLLNLRDQIESGCIEVGNYRYFKIFEPKERQICASAFPEQVLHHALMNVCHERFEQAQIFDSYASRKGKGVYAALERSKGYTQKCEWYLKLDIRKFFESLHTITTMASGHRRLVSDMPCHWLLLRNMPMLWNLEKTYFCAYKVCLHKGENRVNRGGSWNNKAENCRAANRNNNWPTNRNNNLGFRLALQLIT